MSTITRLPNGLLRDRQWLSRNQFFTRFSKRLFREKKFQTTSIQNEFSIQNIIGFLFVFCFLLGREKVTMCHLLIQFRSEERGIIRYSVAYITFSQGSWDRNGSVPYFDEVAATRSKPKKKFEAGGRTPASNFFSIHHKQNLRPNFFFFSSLLWIPKDEGPK